MFAAFNASKSALAPLGLLLCMQAHPGREGVAGLGSVPTRACLTPYQACVALQQTLPPVSLLLNSQYYAELGMPAQARLLAEQAEAAGGGAGVLGSLRGAVGGTVGSLVSRMQGERG